MGRRRTMGLRGLALRPLGKSLRNLGLGARPDLRATGLCAGALVATYITVEAPFSGMSMNPARTCGSGLSAGVWTGFWIYLIAPLLGMLSAAELYLWRKGKVAVKCCKLHHDNDKRCIFCGANGGFAS